MPKVTLNHEGKLHVLYLQHTETSKKDIERVVQAHWGLKLGDYSLTYLDMDEDEITAEV